jgi:hypothetical protein
LANWRIVPPASIVDIRAAIAHPTTLVYLTFGTSHGAAWRNAVWALGDYAMLEMFLNADESVLEQIPWPADRRRADGEPLGDAAPKGVFISRDGKVALVLVGRQAEQPSSLRTAHKLAGKLVGGP